VGRAIYGVSAGRDSPSLLPAPLRTRVYLCTSASTVAAAIAAACIIYSRNSGSGSSNGRSASTQRASSSGRPSISWLPASRSSATLHGAAPTGSQTHVSRVGGARTRVSSATEPTGPALDLATSGRPETRSDIVEPSAGLPTTQAHRRRAEASRSVGISHPE